MVSLFDDDWLSYMWIDLRRAWERILPHDCFKMCCLLAPFWRIQDVIIHRRQLDLRPTFDRNLHCCGPFWSRHSQRPVPLFWGQWFFTLSTGLNLIQQVFLSRCSRFQFWLTIAFSRGFQVDKYCIYAPVVATRPKKRSLCIRQSRLKRTIIDEEKLRVYLKAHQGGRRPSCCNVGQVLKSWQFCNC